MGPRQSRQVEDAKISFQMGVMFSFYTLAVGATSFICFLFRIHVTRRFLLYIFGMFFFLSRWTTMLNLLFIANCSFVVIQPLLVGSWLVETMLCAREVIGSLVPLLLVPFGVLCLFSISSLNWIDFFPLCFVAAIGVILQLKYMPISSSPNGDLKVVSAGEKNQLYRALGLLTASGFLFYNELYWRFWGWLFMSALFLLPRQQSKHILFIVMDKLSLVLCGSKEGLSNMQRRIQLLTGD